MRARKRPVIRRRPHLKQPHQRAPGSSLSATRVAKEPSSQDPGRPATRVGAVRPIFISTLNDPKCIELRKQGQRDNNFDNVSDEDLEKLLAHLREYEQQCGTQRDYDKANEAREMRKKVLDIIHRRSVHHIDEDARARDLKEIDKDIQDREKNIKREINAYDKKTAERTRDAFIKKWEDDQPNRYRKSSVQLLHLKSIEKSLVVAGDYTGAKEMQRIIGEKENAEVEEQQEILNDHFRAAKEKLVAEQQEAMENLEEQRKARKELSIMHMSADLQSVKNRKEVIRKKDYSLRVPRSDGMTKTVSYGKSFAHIARDNNFGIQPLLPALKPPTDKRQLKIHTESTRKSIVMCAPRAFTATSSVFETQPTPEKKNLPLRENSPNQLKHTASRDDSHTSSGSSSGDDRVPC